MARKTSYVWGYAPDRRRKPTVPDRLKQEVETKGNALVEKALKPRYITPPPVASDFNYPIDIWTKWHGSFFYFGSTWTSPGLNRITPTFEVRFARLEYVGNQQFNLAWFRHTEKWHTIFAELTLEECLKLIGDGGLFTLV